MEWIVIAIVVAALLFDYTNGFHDAANVIATVLATGVLAPLSAIVIAGILNFLGATRVSGVAETIATGVIQTESTTQLVVLCAVIGAICWNFITWYFAIPSSSSYALIGSLVGASYAAAGAESILWKNIVGKVLVPMVLSPIVGFCIALLLMKILFFYVTKRPNSAAKNVFKHLQIGSACFVALSHGLNDAQKSMGVITLGLFSGGYLSTMQIPLWVVFCCALFIALGTAFGGFRIIKTMGFSITKLDPIQGFAAETSSSIVILIASFLGMPLSTTHVIAGGITGVGAAKHIEAVHWRVPQKIIMMWIFTLPTSALMSGCIYALIHSIFF